MKILLAECASPLLNWQYNFSDKAKGIIERAFEGIPHKVVDATGRDKWMAYTG